ncbi:MAG: SPOR domain-containing protein, partial [Pseudomonadota bacterium]
DMVRAGTAFVEVTVLTPGTLDDSAATLSAATTATAPLASPRLYVQAGAFGVQDNATRLVNRLQAAGVASAVVRNPAPGSSLYRVRVGPVADVADFDRLVAQLATLGIEARLSADF